MINNPSQLSGLPLRFCISQPLAANRSHLTWVGSALRADLGANVQIGLRPVQRCKS